MNARAILARTDADATAADWQVVGPDMWASVEQFELEYRLRLRPTWTIQCPYCLTTNLWDRAQCVQCSFPLPSTVRP